MITTNYQASNIGPTSDSEPFYNQLDSDEISELAHEVTKPLLDQNRAALLDWTQAQQRCIDQNVSLDQIESKGRIPHKTYKLNVIKCNLIAETAHHLFTTIFTQAQALLHANQPFQELLFKKMTKLYTHFKKEHSDLKDFEEKKVTAKAMLKQNHRDSILEISKLIATRLHQYNLGYLEHSVEKATVQIEETTKVQLDPGSRSTDRLDASNVIKRLPSQAITADKLHLFMGNLMSPALDSFLTSCKEELKSLTAPTPTAPPLPTKEEPTNSAYSIGAGAGAGMGREAPLS